MSTRLEDLTPATQAAAMIALADLAAQGVPAVVTYTFRTYEEQAALYAQGRHSLIEVNTLRARAGLRPISESENTYTVTRCNGRRISEGGTGRSAHQLRTALDVVPLEGDRAVWPKPEDQRWKQIAAAFVARGFVWGGDWDGDGKTRYDGDTDEEFVDFPHYEYKGAA